MTRIFVFLILFFASQISFAQDSASGAAKSSALQGLLTAGTNVATGAMMYSMCTSQKQPFLCVLGGLSMAQAALDMLSSKSSKAAAKAVLASNGGVADWDTVDLGNGISGAEFDQKLAGFESQLNKTKAELAKQGIDIDKGIVDTPKGKKALGSLGSGAALAAAGLLSADQIAEADDIIKKNNAKLAQITLQTSPGGGGGGGSTAKAVKYEYQAPDYGSMFGEKEKPNAPKTAGLVKTVDGQPYGASVNNIFDMLRNRYEIKTREKFFVE